MIDTLRRDATRIVHDAIEAVMPDQAVRQALEGRLFPGRVYLAAVGKAAWQMAHAAAECLSGPIEQGIVLTKYGHVKGALPNIACFEAGHPVPDENTLTGTKALLDMTRQLAPQDTVIFLLSGGGSALFEQPRTTLKEIQSVTKQLLASGADIVEMNTIRKRLSLVKGGQFALHCAPAGVEAIVLSDVLGDPLDMIASGPAAPDASTSEQAQKIAEKYHLEMSDEARVCLSLETPKQLSNVHSQIIGSVGLLCKAAESACGRLAYKPVFLTDRLTCEAREAGRFLAAIAQSHAGEGKRLAFIAGGETVVHVTGKGLGGRNQEIALAAAPGLDGLNAAVFSVGSDGTDGPTDAAGGYADGDTLGALRKAGVDFQAALDDNDAYHALKAVDGLILTGPTGTNVNDLSLVLTG